MTLQFGFKTRLIRGPKGFHFLDQYRHLLSALGLTLTLSFMYSPSAAAQASAQGAIRIHLTIPDTLEARILKPNKMQKHTFFCVESLHHTPYKIHPLQRGTRVIKTTSQHKPTMTQDSCQTHHQQQWLLEKGKSGSAEVLLIEVI